MNDARPYHEPPLVRARVNSVGTYAWMYGVARNEKEVALTLASLFVI